MVHRYTCSGCAFQVRSEDDDELIELVRTHAKDAHDMEMTKRDVRGGWEEVEVATD